MIKAIYAGTFDLITNGHLDIIKRSMKFCDELIIAIGINPNKKTMFTEEERILHINLAINNIALRTDQKITTSSFQGLLVNYAKEMEAALLVRGIRSVSDFDYEINLANINKALAPNIETVFLPTTPELAVVSSSMIKEIAKMGGDVTQFAPKHVVNAINKQFGFTKFGD